MPQKKAVWEFVEILLVAFLLAFAIRSLLIQPFKIPSGSMRPTLQEGDFLFITRFSYGLKIPFTNIEIFRNEGPQRGDIIVFRYPPQPSLDYIKRVIGLPGDVIEMRDKILYRNGERVTEPYIQNTDPYIYQGRDNMAPRTVPPDHYFVMGDNRDGSADSREWGFVPRENIHGRAWFIWWSWDGFDFVWQGLFKLPIRGKINIHFDRIGNSLRS